MILSYLRYKNLYLEFSCFFVILKLLQLFDGLAQCQASYAGSLFVSRPLSDGIVIEQGIISDKVKQINDVENDQPEAGNHWKSLIFH